jgi:hypothetical protein
MLSQIKSARSLRPERGCAPTNAGVRTLRIVAAAPVSAAAASGQRRMDGQGRQLNAVLRTPSKLLARVNESQRGGLTVENCGYFVVFGSDLLHLRGRAYDSLHRSIRLIIVNN